MGQEQQNMASGFPNLSNLNPEGLGDEYGKNIDAIQKTLDDLEARYQQPNWFKIAAGFAKPQLGGFVASLGSAAEAQGENIEQQRRLAIPLAQMRAQLGVQSAVMGQNKKAADYLDSWQQEHPGQPIPKDVYEHAASISPNTPRVLAAGKALDFAQKQQGQDLQAQSQAVDILSKQLAAHTIDQPTYNARLAALYEQSPYAQRFNTLPPTPATEANPTPAAPQPSVATQPAQNATNAQAWIDANHNIESPTGAPSKTSSAIGPGQMTQKTREGIHDKYNMSATPDQYGKDANVTQAYDYALLGDHHSAMANANIDPTALNHRMMWHFGADDGAKLLQADPKAKLGDLLSDKVLAANGYNKNMSVGALKAKEEGNLWNNGLDPNSLVKFGDQATAQAPQEPKKPTIFSATVPMPDLSKVNPSDYEFVRNAAKDKAAAVEKPRKDEYDSLSYLNRPALFHLANSSTNEAIQAIQQRPELARKVFNVVRQAGPLAAAGQAGIGIQIGPYGAHLNVPVEAWLNAKIDPKDQAYADMLAQKIATSGYFSMVARGINPENAGADKMTLAMQQEPVMRNTGSAALAALKQNKDLFQMSQELHQAYANGLKRTDQNSLTPLHDIYMQSEDMANTKAKFDKIAQKRAEKHLNSFKEAQ